MANEVQKLSAKLNSLLWVPSGEIDDTRFEKLLDGLQSTCLVDDYSINHHQGPQGLKCLLQQNTLDIIHSSVKNMDLWPQPASTSLRLLGFLCSLLYRSSSSFQTYLDTCIGIIEEILSSYHEALTSDLQTHCAVLQLCHLSLPALEDRYPTLEKYLRSLCLSGLTSHSHFVQSEAVNLIKQLANQYHDTLPLQVMHDIDQNGSCYNELSTSLRIIDALATSNIPSPKIPATLFRHVWMALVSPDSMISELARCCFRNIIRSEVANCLMGSMGNNQEQAVDNFRLELNSVLHSLVSMGTQRDICNAILLINWPDQCSTPYEEIYKNWCRKLLLTLLTISQDNSGPTSYPLDPPFELIHKSYVWRKQDSFIREQLCSLLMRNVNLLTTADADLSIGLSHFIMHSIQIIQHSKYSAPYFPTSTLRLASKLVKMLQSLFELSCNHCIGLVDITFGICKELLSSTDIPTQLSIDTFILMVKGLPFLASETAWKLFEDFMPILQLCRSKSAWEIRDSLIEFIGIFINRFPNPKKMKAMALERWILSGKDDSSEHVRSSCYRSISSVIVDSDSFNAILVDPVVSMQDLFGRSESQSESRLAQIELLLQFFLNDHCLSYISNDFSCIATLLDAAQQDEDWEIRNVTALVLCEVAKCPVDQSQLKLLRFNAKERLHALTVDECRTVRRTAWKSISQIEPDLDSQYVESMINRQEFDPSLECDEIDDVYPLDRPETDNDPDCPF